MRFKQFISEVWVRGEGNFSPTPLSTPDWIEWVKGNCKKSLANSANNPIFRGMGSNGITAIKDTNDFTRRSANTQNLYTIWMDHHPAWAAYPKRSKSYICSTSPGTSIDFGELHLVIPSDTAKIGLAPQFDLWHSFGTMGLDELSNSSYELLELLGSDPRAIQIDWAALQKALKAATPSALVTELPQNSGTANRLRNWALELIGAHGNSLYDVFESYLDPKATGFKHFEAPKFVKAPDKEVWVQGKVALLNIEWLRKSDDEELLEFVKSYNLNVMD